MDALELELYTKKSSINTVEKGLYTAEPILKKSVVSLFTESCFFCTESEYNQEQERGNHRIIRTGVRYIHDIFLFEKTMNYEEDKFNYINHSFTPNTLYHCGILFATEDIPAHSELTVDYRLFLSENDLFKFIDGETQKEVTGFSGKEALAYSTQQLTDLFK